MLWLVTLILLLKNQLVLSESIQKIYEFSTKALLGLEYYTKPIIVGFAGVLFMWNQPSFNNL